MTHRSLTNLSILMLTACILCILAAPNIAQDIPTPDGDVITEGRIDYGQTVTDTITDGAIFDLWTFEGMEGDEVVVVMRGVDGLAPLLGLLGPDSSVILRSDVDPNGNSIDVSPNGTAELRFALPITGEFTLNASRIGTAQGTTSGSYSLTLERIDQEPDRVNPFQDVVFVCDGDEVTTATTIYLNESNPAPNPEVTVIGFNGFEPVLRLREVNGDDIACVTTRQPFGDGDELGIPGLSAFADGMQVASMIPVTGDFFEIEVIVGSRNGAPGDYIVLIDGQQILPRRDGDGLSVRLGPLATDQTMQVYMLAEANTRIDPIIEVFSSFDDDNPIVTCDDAGWRECADVARASEIDVTVSGRVLRGDLLDAGVYLTHNTVDERILQITDRSGRTTGRYTLLLIGQLPAEPPGN